MNFPQKAYLECEDLRQGPCSERILRFKTLEGDTINGFFDCSNIQKWLGLKVTALDQIISSVQVAIPQNNVYGSAIRADARYYVKREQIIYESDMKYIN